MWQESVKNSKQYIIVILPYSFNHQFTFHVQQRQNNLPYFHGIILITFRYFYYYVKGPLEFFRTGVSIPFDSFKSSGFTNSLNGFI